MKNSISNQDAVIDSRQVIERIEELGAIRDELREEFDETPENAGADFHAWVRNQVGFSSEEYDELLALEKLAGEGDTLADWKYGETLVRESYFETYAQELADDIGAINRDATWPNDCIDWGRAARELLMDYTSLDFDGVTYYARG